jgi:hypothetical protein
MESRTEGVFVFVPDEAGDGLADGVFTIMVASEIMAQCRNPIRDLGF